MSYVDYLRFLTDDFPTFFINELKLKEIVYDQIFRDIEKLYGFHKKFLSELKHINDCKNERCLKLIELFNKYIPFLRIYSQYIGTLQYRRELATNLLNDGKLKDYEKRLNKYFGEFASDRYSEEFRKQTVVLSLLDSLEKPSGRYFKYKLFFQQYIKEVYPPSKQSLDTSNTLSLFNSLMS